MMGLGCLRGVDDGFNFTGRLNSMQYYCMRGSSLVQIGNNEKSELFRKEGVMEGTFANGQYKDSQLPAT